ncbi:MAG: hypothetical protein J6J35_05865 [Alphaproteobacteria bacterium]|nr:hypothetical protein [Alphaproteobacteria bacterium]
MKPLLIIIKTLIIGYLWSIIFIDGVRVLLLINWHFDIFLKQHWSLLSYKWNSGAGVSNSELGFFLIVVSSIPLWLAGWVGLCLVKWQRMLKRIFFSPLYLYRKLTLKTKAPVVVKKKSVTEEVKTIKKTPIIKKAPIKRPPLPSATLLQSNINNNLSATRPSTSFQASKKNPEMPENHALFNFDDDDFDLDFDFDSKPEPEKIPTALAVDTPKTIEMEQPQKEKTAPTPKVENKAQTNNNKKENQNKNKSPEAAPIKESHTPVLDVLKQKGFDIIPSAIIKNTTIDYIAVSKDQLLLCLVDKESGDWLADEEKFNDEEPLWFSESSHRISPVRKIDLARDILKTKLAVADMNFEILSYVVIQAGNIINAEDMFEIWNTMNIRVTRINRGSPKEIHLFSKAVDTCEEKTDKNTLEKLKKLIRSLA